MYIFYPVAFLSEPVLRMSFETLMNKMEAILQDCQLAVIYMQYPFTIYAIVLTVDRFLSLVLRRDDAWTGFRILVDNLSVCFSVLF